MRTTKAYFERFKKEFLRCIEEEWETVVVRLEKVLE